MLIFIILEFTCWSCCSQMEFCRKEHGLYRAWYKGMLLEKAVTCANEVLRMDGPKTPCITHHIAYYLLSSSRSLPISSTVRNFAIYTQLITTIVECDCKIMTHASSLVQLSQCTCLWTVHKPEKTDMRKWWAHSTVNTYVSCCSMSLNISLQKLSDLLSSWENFRSFWYPTFCMFSLWPSFASLRYGRWKRMWRSLKRMLFMLPKNMTTVSGCYQLFAVFNKYIENVVSW